jgi:pyruvate kinase
MSLSQSSEVPLLAGGFIDLKTILHPAPSHMLRRTKIICTIGPASWEVEQLETLMKVGMNVARLNFSHGDHAGHLAVLQRVRQAAENTGRNCGTYLLSEWCIIMVLYIIYALLICVSFLIWSPLVFFVI